MPPQADLGRGAQEVMLMEQRRRCDPLIPRYPSLLFCSWFFKGGAARANLCLDYTVQAWMVVGTIVGYVLRKRSFEWSSRGDAVERYTKIMIIA